MMRFVQGLVGAAVLTLAATARAQQPARAPEYPPLDPAVTGVVTGGEWNAADSSSGSYRVV
ncbi:MAG TPA: hypothetical protein VJY65_03215, partial [Chloroflexota bacterium]|nr:hypothetical protein [Chloroflexota bacterium]